jgi:hypothetical protein
MSAVPGCDQAGCEPDVGAARPPMSLSGVMSECITMNANPRADHRGCCGEGSGPVTG